MTSTYLFYNNQTVMVYARRYTRMFSNEDFSVYPSRNIGKSQQRKNQIVTFRLNLFN